MKRRITTLFALLFMLGFAGQAAAQMEVTVREINAISQASLDELNTNGTTLTLSEIADTGCAGILFQDTLCGEEVQFTAVVLSDPLNSGLSTPDSDGFPSRIHVFVRDISAATEGNEGMTIQIVDGSYQTTGLLDVTIGDVIEVVANVSNFGTALQLEPVTITLLGTYNDATFNLPDTILDPVVITSDEANMSVGPDGEVQINWNNYASLNDQYVRVENAIVQVRSLDDPPGRHNWLISSDGGETVLNFYDISLRYRNDRDGSYNADVFNVKDFEFVPPPPGSRINLQGFLVFQGDDPFARGVPQGSIFSIVPFEDSDLEITESPPQVLSLSRPDFVPTTDPVTVTFDVVPDPTRTITRVELLYTTSSSTDVISVAATNTGGDTYSADLPAQPHGTFVTYWVEAEDNQGGVTVSDPLSIRFMPDGFDAIEDLQLTADESEGDSPFTGLTIETNITATVQSNPSVSGMVSIQDDPGLAPWSGILLDTGSDGVLSLNRGDVITITEATVEELFGVTQLTNVVFTVTDTADPYDYKLISTDALLQDKVIEAHEGMLLRFEDVTIIDPDEGFGEWSFSSDGTTENAVLADDRSDAIASDFASTTFTEGDVLDFIQGIWWFSFGNYKLVPEDPETDIGAVINVATEDEALPGRYALHQNFPNPFNPATTIRYDLARTGRVTLEVFDLLGRRITTLVDGEQTVGTHAVTFDARDLASGVYLYRLTAGKQVITKTMLLLK